MTRLTDALDALLTAAVDTLTDPPDCRYLSAGAPEVTCALVAVYPGTFLHATLDQPSGLPRPFGQPVVRVPTLMLEVWRATCEAQNPSAAQHDADGRVHADDGWNLNSDLIPLLKTGGAFADLTPEPSAGNVDLAEAVREGYAGWRLSVALQL